jgi:Mn-dependent DtxR family transcriptional regulator
MTQEQKAVTPRTSAEAREDYLEMISELIQTKGFASVSDIAERMNVAKSSATSIIKKLDKEGYVVHVRYRGLALTDSGKHLASKMKHRHETLTRLLLILGIPEKIAREDAEKIEHGLQNRSLHRLEELTSYLEANPEIVQKLNKSAASDPSIH